MYIGFYARRKSVFGEKCVCAFCWRRRWVRLYAVIIAVWNLCITYAMAEPGCREHMQWTVHTSWILKIWMLSSFHRRRCARFNAIYLFMMHDFYSFSHWRFRDPFRQCAHHIKYSSSSLNLYLQTKLSHFHSAIDLSYLRFNLKFLPLETGFAKRHWSTGSGSLNTPWSDLNFWTSCFADSLSARRCHLCHFANIHRIHICDFGCFARANEFRSTFIVCFKSKLHEDCICAAFWQMCVYVCEILTCNT